MFRTRRHIEDCFTDRASPLSNQIAYGVIRYYFHLKSVLDSLLDKPLPDKHRDVELLIISGLYSMTHLKRPAHASVNACVEATVKLKKTWAKGLVNGVLRRYGREHDRLDQDADEHIEARLNHPEWLIHELEAAWPDAGTLFTVNNERAPMTLRVNETCTDRESVMAELAAAGIGSAAGRLVSTAVILERPVPVTDLPGFAEGRVSVQDEAPQLAPSLMNLAPGQRVLDACAAPGGKTCHLLEYCRNLQVTALDRDRKRIHRISENLERLSLSADVLCEELESFNPTHPFDRILLDVPCSATGIIRRHPDIKLLRDDEDIAKLSRTQLVLLKKAFELLSHDGELLYSTCSILPRENDDIITAFVAHQPDAELIPVFHPAITGNPATAGLQLLPESGGHDGFYYAVIRKSGVPG